MYEIKDYPKDNESGCDEHDSFLSVNLDQGWNTLPWPKKENSPDETGLRVFFSHLLPVKNVEDFFINLKKNYPDVTEIFVDIEHTEGVDESLKSIFRFFSKFQQITRWYLRVVSLSKETASYLAKRIGQDGLTIQSFELTMRDKAEKYVNVQGSFFKEIEPILARNLEISEFIELAKSKEPLLDKDVCQYAAVVIHRMWAIEYKFKLNRNSLESYISENEEVKNKISEARDAHLIMAIYRGDKQAIEAALKTGSYNLNLECQYSQKPSNVVGFLDCALDPNRFLEVASYLIERGAKTVSFDESFFDESKKYFSNTLFNFIKNNNCEEPSYLAFCQQLCAKEATLYDALAYVFFIKNEDVLNVIKKILEDKGFNKIKFDIPLSEGVFRGYNLIQAFCLGLDGKSYIDHSGFFDSFALSPDVLDSLFPKGIVYKSFKDVYKPWANWWQYTVLQVLVYFNQYSIIRLFSAKSALSDHAAVVSDQAVFYPSYHLIQLFLAGFMSFRGHRGLRESEMANVASTLTSLYSELKSLVTQEEMLNFYINVSGDDLPVLHSLSCFNPLNAFFNDFHCITKLLQCVIESQDTLLDKRINYKGHQLLNALHMAIMFGNEHVAKCLFDLYSKKRNILDLLTENIQGNGEFSGCNLLATLILRRYFSIMYIYLSKFRSETLALFAHSFPKENYYSCWTMTHLALSYAVCSNPDQTLLDFLCKEKLIDPFISFPHPSVGTVAHRVGGLYPLSVLFLKGHLL